MSQPTVCPGNILNLTPCMPATGGGTTCTTFGTNSTGLLLYNNTGEDIIALSQNVTPQLCFTIQTSYEDVQPVFMVTNPGSTLVQFAFFGVSDSKPYGQAITSPKMPAQPISITPTAPPIVAPSDMGAGWQFPDIRKKKPIWVLILGGVFLLAGAIMLIVVGAMRNQQVMRIYGELKGAKDEESMQLLAEDEGLTEEYQKFKANGLIAGGVVLILVIAGLVVAMMFLPGFPLSKYMSYGYCQALAQSDQLNLWSWSLPPESGFFSFACRALGACICRSTKLETDCLLYRITNTSYMPNPWQSALKKAPLPKNCLCCDGSQCGTVVDGKIESCVQ